MSAKTAGLAILYAVVGACTAILPMAEKTAGSWRALFSPAVVLAAIVGAANALHGFYNTAARPVRVSDPSPPADDARGSRA